MKPVNEVTLTVREVPTGIELLVSEAPAYGTALDVIRSVLVVTVQAMAADPVRVAQNIVDQLVPILDARPTQASEVH